MGKLFYSFDETEKALNELKEKENHPLRVYNSQRVEDYNRKQSGLKYAGQLGDVSKFRYTYLLEYEACPLWRSSSKVQRDQASSEVFCNGLPGHDYSLSQARKYQELQDLFKLILFSSTVLF